MRVVAPGNLPQAGRPSAAEGRMPESGPPATLVRPRTAPLWRIVLYRVHWAIGLTAGVVLAVMALTGAALSFRPELQAAFGPELAIDATAPHLPVDELLSRVEAQRPGTSLRSVSWNAPDAPVEARLNQGEGHGTVALVDPATGAILGSPWGESGFALVEKIHRTLAMGEAGKRITGWSTVGLLLMALSGLVLRWPRRAFSVRAWLAVNGRLKGRGFIWHLHSVIGTWLLPLFALAALTGLWWSFESYRNALLGMAGLPPRPPAAAQRADAAQAPARPPLAAAHAAFREAVPQAERVVLGMPRGPEGPIEWRYLTADASHDRAFDVLRVAHDGSVVSHDRYIEQRTGQRLVGSIYPLHVGSYFGLPGRVLVLVASLSLPLFAITGWYLWLSRRRRAAREAIAAGGMGRDAPELETEISAEPATANRIA